MARCGCTGSTSCSCRVMAGANITVSGSGSTSNPYVIASACCGTPDDPLTVNDSPTIDLTLNSPLTADLKISADPGNALVVHPDGVFVPASVTPGGVVLSAQVKLLAASQAWTPADVTGTLTGVSFTVLSGTADLLDANGTPANNLPTGSHATWNAEDANTLIGPQSITADLGSSVLVTWTESP